MSWRPALGLLCLAFAVFGAAWLEASMLRHMLLQLPLLLAAGSLLASAPLLYWSRIVRIDQHGISGLTALLMVSAYWMIPRALELSLAHRGYAVAKFASMLVVGWWLPGALRRAHVVVQVFYLGNLSWMMAMAGLLYQDLPQRLCNAYLLDDQEQTGRALVLAALLIGGCCLCRLRAAQSTATGTCVAPVDISDPG